MSAIKRNITSYCACQEDYHLYRMLGHTENGFYVDVGASFPDCESITKVFYDRGWSGINVEPLEDEQALLCRERPRDINLQCVVSEKPGKQILYCCRSDSTLDRKSSEEISRLKGSAFVEKEVDAVTLRKILNKYVPSGKTIHFIKIDVELHERSVLLSMDFEDYRPWVFCVEATLPNTTIPNHEDWEYLLLRNGYRHIDTGTVYNRFYIADEMYDELRRRYNLASAITPIFYEVRRI